MSAYKFAGQLPVPTYDAEVLCGPFCSGGRVSFTATTSPEFTELYDVWVKAEDAATLAAERDQLAAENARLSHGLQYLYDTIGREMERIHALLKTPGDKPHLFTVWTHLNSMHNQARAALSPAPAKKEAPQS